MKANYQFYKITFLGALLLLLVAPFFVSAANKDYPDGTLLKSNDDAKVWVIHNDKKRWIRTEEIFNTYEYNWNNIQTVDSDTLNTLPINNLVRDKDDIKVYALNDVGYKRHVPNPEVFTSYGYDWGDVAIVNTTEVVNYPETKLIKETGDSKVYYIDENQEKRWVNSEETFIANSFNWEAVHTINLAEAKIYPTGSNITTNINIKSSNSATPATPATPAQPNTASSTPATPAQPNTASSTPATPATPATPSSGGGGGASPATPATPATPGGGSTPTTPTECSASTVCGESCNYGGQTYNTVLIGTQCWFKENLNVGTIIGNTEVPDNTAPTLNNPSTVSKWCYNDSSTYCTDEGGLYTWAEANAQPHSCNSTSCSVPTPNQGICPIGWHIPTDEEFYTLENYLKIPGETCDATRAGWGCFDAGAKLELGGSSGFDAIGAGNHETTGETSFFDKREPSAHFWSSSPCLNCSNYGHSYNRYLYIPALEDMVGRGWSRNTHGFSVRCLADTPTTPEPSDTTAPIISNIQVNNITETSAVITWITDEDSSGLIEYGLSASSYNLSIPTTVTVSGTGFVHTVSLDNLTANTTYYYKVSSTDSSENKAKSEEQTFITLSSPVVTVNYFNDFNNGNADGWLSVAGYPPGTHGNWRVEDGVVIQDQGRDHFGFVLDNFSMSDQTVEAKVLWHDNGYAGITIWNQDANNWVQISYPYQGGFGIWENINGNGLVYPTAIYPVEINQRIWQVLKVDTNSSTGEIAVYLDDEYLFTHTVGANAPRTGLSGFNSGNAGGSFDDFSLISK
ncbi:MAG: FISUMP domain-containing protein [bacterium]